MRTRARPMHASREGRLAYSPLLGGIHAIAADIVGHMRVLPDVGEVSHLDNGFAPSKFRYTMTAAVTRALTSAVQAIPEL
ncbi:hypothetical protein GCM10022383_06620 [Microbacterium soli]|uniref:Uncharacterized protein n=1 Tax=Microbacterium soli TaxID=446075 RepID=A0ABP7MVF4_9MICO